MVRCMQHSCAAHRMLTTGNLNDRLHWLFLSQHGEAMVTHMPRVAEDAAWAEQWAAVMGPQSVLQEVGVCPPLVRGMG